MSQDSLTLEQKVDSILTFVQEIPKLAADIDALALATGNGFKEVHEEFKLVHARIDNLTLRVDSVEDNLGSKIDKVNNNTIGISARVEVLEDSMRVVRGKLGLT